MADTATNHKYVPSTPGDWTVTGKFGANGKAAQAAVTANAALPVTGTTTTTPFGFTTATQGDQMVALVNQMRAALVAMGVMA